MSDKWAAEVLSFWFEELTQEDWFMQNDGVDKAIAERFGDLYRQLKSSPPSVADANAETAVAAVIVLDQFSRNMFRGSAEAFGADNIAVALSSQAIEAGLDTKLGEDQRCFLYMPFMHSETLADQERGIMLFRALGRENNLKYAIEHRDVVAKFGRFPHRNRALGRESTPEELDYLKTASGYGQ